MKKMMKSLFAGLMVLTLCMGTTTTFANMPEDVGITVGDTINVDGKEYRVYSVDEDGAHITDTLKMPRAKCPSGSHSYIKQPGTSSKDVKVANNSSTCYQHFIYSRSRCSKCGDMIVVQDSSVNKVHKYAFLDKTCTNKVNNTSCTYTKK